MEKIESPLDGKRSCEMKKIQEEGNPCSHEVDEQRWQAVCDRNQVWDGIFVFAIRTTGGVLPTQLYLPESETGKCFFLRDSISS